jgi:hypothetical protein
VEVARVQVDVRLVQVALERERDVGLGHLVQVLVDDLCKLVLHVVPQSIGREHVPEGDVDLHARLLRVRE